MRFWDSSAIVPLLAWETGSKAVLAALEDDPELIVWWATEIECVSALARLEREGALDRGSMNQALGRLAELARAWHEIQPVARVRQTAIRLLRVHRLRAADALQLAAALVAAEGDPTSLEVVTLDERLAEGAEREGFRVLGPALS